MKKYLLPALTLAAVALFARPAFAAEHAHDHGNAAQAAPEGAAVPAGELCDLENMMQESLQKMRGQMARINQAKDPNKRRKLLQEHNQSMRDSIRMLRVMMAEMTMGPAPGSAMPSRMMGGGRAGDRMMGGNMAGMKCDHGKGGPMASRPDDNAASIARSNPDQAAASANAPAGTAKKLWLCPMHPDEVQDHPGTCKICGMDLVDKGELDAPFAGEAPAKDNIKCDHMAGGKMRPMMGMGGRHMGAVLMLMEQLIEHNEAAMAPRK